MAYGQAMMLQGIQRGVEQTNQRHRQQDFDEMAKERHSANMEAHDQSMGIRDTQQKAAEFSLDRAKTGAEREDILYDEQRAAQRMAKELGQALLIGEATGEWATAIEIWNNELADAMGAGHLEGFEVVTDKEGQRTVRLTEAGKEEVREVPYEEFMEQMIMLAQPEAMLGAIQNRHQAQQAAQAAREEALFKHSLDLDKIQFTENQKRHTEQMKKDDAANGIKATDSNAIRSVLSPAFGTLDPQGNWVFDGTNADNFVRANAVASRAYQLGGGQLSHADAAMLGYQVVAGEITPAKAQRMAQAEFEQSGAKMTRSAMREAVNARTQELVAQSQRAQQVAAEMGILDDLVMPVGQRSGARPATAEGDEDRSARALENAERYLQEAAGEPVGMGLGGGR